MMDKLQNLNGFEFFENVAKIIEQARKYVGRTADLTKCITNYEIGRMIVEEEQGGKARAAYGKRLLDGLSVYLNKRVGKGFSVSTLTNARKFYSVYAPSISQAMLTKLDDGASIEKSQAMLTKLAIACFDEKQQALLGEFANGLTNKKAKH